MNAAQQIRILLVRFPVRGDRILRDDVTVRQYLRTVAELFRIDGRNMNIPCIAVLPPVLPRIRHRSFHVSDVKGMGIYIAVPVGYKIGITANESAARTEYIRIFACIRKPRIGKFDPVVRFHIIHARNAVLRIFVSHHEFLRQRIELYAAVGAVEYPLPFGKMDPVVRGEYIHPIALLQGIGAIYVVFPVMI